MTRVPKQTAKEKKDCSTARYQTIGSNSLFQSGVKKYTIPSTDPSVVSATTNRAMRTEYGNMAVKYATCN